MSTPRTQILTRLYTLMVLLALLPVLVVAQLLRVHWVEGPTLREQGQQQAESIQTIPAMRGTIFDRAGRVLATNTARYELAVDPGLKGFAPKALQFYKNLERLTGTRARVYRQRVRKSKSPRYTLLERSLAEAHKEIVETWDIPGVMLTPRFARRYTYGATGSHLLGLVDADYVGIDGVEKQYNEVLKGQHGRRIVKRDRRGYIKAYVGSTTVEPEHGEHLTLTIDVVRQAILEEELLRGVAEAGARWGTAIAMDPYTGAILALANAPTYDLNRPSAFPKDNRYNHAIADRIEPGSTFKLVTAIAAIETGAISMEDTVDTAAGFAVIRGRGMYDTHGHGRIPFREVLSQSSNIGTAKTALRLEPETLYRYARDLGFGQHTWIDLPAEVGGRLKKPHEWSRLTQPWMSHGYEVDVTPLQMLVAYAALANGGIVVQPHVVAERRNVRGERVWRARQDSIRRAFTSETARTLMPAFEEVITDGTAKRAAVEGLRIAGKTGTAQKAKNGSYNRRAYRATFVGFYPVEAPEVAMIVVLDEPKTSGYGGVVSAPIFQRTTERWVGTFPNIAARIAPSEPIPAREEVQIPDVVNQPVTVAIGRLVATGFSVNDIRAKGFEAVAVQMPPAGTLTAASGAVALEVAADAAQGNTMPDVVGLSTRQAVAWLSALGTHVEVKGRGVVLKQYPAAGQTLPPRVALTAKRG